MTRLSDPVSELGTIKGESASARKRREAEARERWARTILENDPTVETMEQARRRAREMESDARGYERDVEAGLITPDGRPTRAGRKALRGSSPGGRGKGRAPARVKRAARHTARSAAAPFGDAMSAGWTLFQGGLSLVLLYVVMRDAKAIGALTEGVTGGLRRFADPTIPLVPRSGELPSSRPDPRNRPRRQTKVTGRKG